MTFLASLKLTALDDARPSIVERRRMRLIENLNEQLTLLNNPSYARVRAKWVKDGEEKSYKERTIPVRPWWREMPDGKVAFFVRSGLRKIEFKKGQSAILVDSKGKLPELINNLITAVGSGELDIFIQEKEEPIQAVRKKAS